MTLLGFCCVFALNSMENLQILTKKRLNPPSQNFLLATLLDAFIKNNYSMVEDLLWAISPDAFDINAPLTHATWKGRVFFNVLHNEYVRRHSMYYPLYKEKECYQEYVDLYATFCKLFKDQININIKDINSDRDKNEGWDIENGKTPLMYIIDRLLACEQSVGTIKNIFMDFSQRFGKDVNPFVTNECNQTMFDLCALQPNDSLNIREKKEYIHGMLEIMTRKIFIVKTGLHQLDNCHFRFIK